MLGFSSCIKTDVAPEVAQIRQAQIDKLKAEVSQILADASYRNVQVRALKMDTYFDSLFNVWSVKSTAAQYDVTLAHIQSQLEIEKKFLAQNQLATAQAVAAYERYIASGKFQENVSQLLGKFNDESRVLQQLYNDRITLMKQIAEGELLIDADSELPWSILKEQLERDLAQTNSELAAAEAALADLKVVYGDPTALETKKAALAAEIEDMWKSYGELDITREEAAEAYTAAAQALDEANMAIELMEDWDGLTYVSGTYGNGFIQDEIDLIADSLGYTKDIADATLALVALNQNLTLLNSTLTSAKTALTAATAAYTAKLTLYNTAVTNQTNAENDILVKANALAVAQNNYEAGLAAIPALTPTALTALQTTRDNAQTAYDNAVDVRDNATTGTAVKLTQATADKDDAKNQMDAAQLDVDNAQIAINGNADPDIIVGGSLMDQINDQNDAIAQAEQNLDDNAIDLSIVRAKLDEWGPKYDAAKLNLATLTENASVLEYKAWTIQLQMWNWEDLIDAKDQVLDVLEGHLDMMATAITDWEDTIEGLKEDVADLETQIAQNGINVTWAQGRVENLQALLATTEVKITESEGIVAYWKKLLDEAIAAAGE
jgi:chromosome segregation ATPase